MAHILLVDDDADGREVLALYLRKLGHHVDDAGGGQEALRKLLDGRPELLILDLRMPEMDGMALLEIMRSYLRWHSVPVILLTGLATSEQLERAKALGVVHMFEKANFKLADLVVAVNQVTGKGPA